MPLTEKTFAAIEELAEGLGGFGGIALMATVAELRSLRSENEKLRKVYLAADCWRLEHKDSIARSGSTDSEYLLLETLKEWDEFEDESLPILIKSSSGVKIEDIRG